MSNLKKSIKEQNSGKLKELKEEIPDFQCFKKNRATSFEVALYTYYKFTTFFAEIQI